MKYKSNYGDVEDVRLEINTYSSNKSLYMELIVSEDGYEEPYGSITVNLGDSVPAYCAYVDTNNMPEMEQFIEENAVFATDLDI